MKFSVLIPVYNTEKYLEECLGSIFGQTYKNFEIILVDDGSTDSSTTICDRYQSEYTDVVKVIHQENQGQLLSRINAIKAAQGDYCIFVDSDDLIVENALEILYNTIKEYKNLDMVIYPFYYDRAGELEKSKVISEKTEFYDKGDNTLRELFFSDILLNSMCTKCVKTSVLIKSVNNTDVFKNLRCSEDRLQSMWVLDNVNTAVYINNPLYRYRLFEGSTTRQYSPDKIDRFNDVILYDEQIKCSKRWGLYSKNWLNRFYAKSIVYLLYIFDVFYANNSKFEKKKVLEYPWKEYLPTELSVEVVKENEYLTKQSKKLFCFIINKNHVGIKMYYVRKNFCKRIKRIKSVLLHGGKNG